ncbi:MAG: transcriptional repressor LexA [Candidatus Latescibacterota bacterium]
MPKFPKQSLPVLTRQQRRVLSFISTFLETEGYAPTLEEIRSHLGLSAVSTVHEHVEKLIEKGYLSRGWNQSRSIALTPFAATSGMMPGTAGRIPLLGRVAAGNPIEAVLDPEDIPVPDSFLGKRDTFALNVAGDSMVDEGILDGDTLIVEKAEVAENGSLVIALIDGKDAVVKRFHRRGRRVELASANEAHPPLMFEANAVRIQGIVVGLLRRYR